MTRFHVELGSARVDHDENDVRERAVWEIVTDKKNAMVYIEKHFALGRAHRVKNRLTMQHGRDDSSGTFLGNPEARTRGIDNEGKILVDVEKRLFFKNPTESG